MSTLLYTYIPTIKYVGSFINSNLSKFSGVNFVDSHQYRIRDIHINRLIEIIAFGLENILF